MKRQKHERSWLHKFNMDAALRYSWESRASALSGDVMGMVHYMHLTLNYLAECGCGSASWPQTVLDVADFKTHADFTGCVLRELRPELFPNNQ